MCPSIRWTAEELLEGVPVTIRDVAKAAGVSITTVSRALNGYQDVGEKTRKKIKEIAEQLNYRPNNVARSLVTRRTQTIGLLVSGMMSDRSGHHFVFEVIRGLHDRLSELDYDMILFSTTTAQQRLVSYLSLCTQRGLDGVIVMGFRLDDPYMNEVVEAPLPSVGIDLPLLSDHCSYVITDNAHGAKVAVRHLLAKGHRRIGFINGHRQAAVSQQRRQGYEAALQEAGLDLDESLICESDFTMEGGRTAFTAIRQRHADMTAVFCASDLMAIGVLQQARQDGIHVPDQLAVVGFDDIDLAEFVDPALTTVHQRRYEMGVVAADTLVAMMREQRVAEGRVLVPELVVRDST